MTAASALAEATVYPVRDPTWRAGCSRVLDADLSVEMNAEWRTGIVRDRGGEVGWSSAHVHAACAARQRWCAVHLQRKVFACWLARSDLSVYYTVRLMFVYSSDN